MSRLHLRLHDGRQLVVHRAPQHRAGSRPPPPRRLLCRADAATRSLEQAVRVLNKVIGIASSPRNRARAEADQKAAKPVKPKWVAFTGGSSAKVDAPGGNDSKRQLADYLALPVSQYSLLDERLVERLDEESFRVTVPLDTITGVQVRPQVLVRVSVDREAGSVTFSSETATLGDPALDKELSLQLRATLGGVAAGDRKAFRRLVRRKPPAWAPHPQPGAGNAAAADSPAAQQQQQQQQQQRQLEDPLAGAQGFRPLQGADVQQSAAVISGAASADGTPADGSNGPGNAAVSQGYSAAVVDGVPVTDGASSSGSSGGDGDHGVGVGSNNGSISNGDSSAAQQEQHQAAGAGSSAVQSLSLPFGNDAAMAQPAGVTDAGSSRAEASAEAQQLAARVDVRVSLNVPPVLRVVPGPLLGYAGGLVLKVALQALLPSFLQLLAQDFAAWSSGDPERGASGRGLIQAAGLEAAGGAEAAEEIPAEWEACDKEGKPVVGVGNAEASSG